MNSRVGISQSNYIPWLGFFEFVSKCDTFVFLESVQYSKNNWRNRNLIRINEMPHWLTVPVRTGNSLSLKINEVNVVDHKWRDKHLASISHAYSSRDSKRNLSDFLTEVFGAELIEMKKLSEINIHILQKIFSILDINVETVKYDQTDSFSKQDRIIHICKSFKASEYITTLKGKSYLIEEDLFNSDLSLDLVTYEKSVGFLTRHNKDSHLNYSIIDTIANVGIDEVRSFLKNV
jgi:hypothetical protein